VPMKPNLVATLGDENGEELSSRSSSQGTDTSTDTDTGSDAENEASERADINADDAKNDNGRYLGPLVLLRVRQDASADSFSPNDALVLLAYLHVFFVRSRILSSFIFVSEDDYVSHYLQWRMIS